MKKMGKNTKNSLLIVAALLLAVWIIVFFRLQSTGFFALQGQTAQVEQKTLEQVPEQKKEVNLNMSFEAVKPTQLAARLVKGQLLPCPQYSALEFEVRNTGKFLAERVFVDFPPNLKTAQCSNCAIKKLSAGAMEIITINACNSLNEGIEVGFSSINAEKQAVKIS